MDLPPLQFDSPEFAPIYAVGRRLERIEELKELRIGVEALQSAAPSPEVHAFIAGAAHIAIEQAIIDEAETVKIERAEIKEQGVMRAANVIAGKTQLAKDLSAERAKLDRVALEYGSLLSYDGENPILVRARDEALADLEERSKPCKEKEERLKAINAGLEVLKTIMNAPVPGAVSSLPKLANLQTKEVSDAQLSAGERFMSALTQLPGKVGSEAQIVYRLFLDDYESDRPLAFKKYDELLHELRSARTKPELVHNDESMALYLGKVYRASSSGVAYGAMHYRVLGLRSSKDYRSTDVFTKQGTPFLIEWSERLSA